MSRTETTKDLALRAPVFAVGAALLAAVIIIAALAPARAGGQEVMSRDNLPLSVLAGNADFYAVLHEDGSLVFQATPSDEAGTTSYPSSLAGYANESTVPWLAAADKIRSVRFASDFTAFQPRSTKYWFCGCTNLETVDLANLDASQSESMRAMFKGCSSLEEIKGLEGLDTSSSTYFGSMFNGCSSIKSLDLSNFTAAHVQVLCYMFNGCSSLESLSLSGPGWNSPSLKLMVRVFEGCSSLKSLDLSGLDTSHVTSMYRDFDGCSSLEYLDLSSIDTSSMGNLTGMFNGCSQLKTVKLGNGFSFCGKKDARQCAFPEGNWKSSSDGKVYAAASIPNNVESTYTLVTDEDITKPAAYGIAVGKTAKVAGCTYKVTSNKKSTVVFKKSIKTKKNVDIPAKVKIKGKKYSVAGIAKNAFKGSKAKTISIKTKKLTRNSVRGCFTGAKNLKVVKVPSAKKKLYTSYFEKPNSGKAVTIKKL